MTRIVSWWARWGPVLLWMGVIFWLSAQPSLPRAPDNLLDLVLKKAAHVGEYAVLSFLLYRAMATRAAFAWRAAGLALAASLLYALSDEWHQSWVPGRSPAATDIGFDLLGAVGGLAVHAIVGRRRTARAGP